MLVLLTDALLPTLCPSTISTHPGPSRPIPAPTSLHDLGLCSFDWPRPHSYFRLELLKYVGCVEAHARTPKLSFPVFAYSPAPMRGSSASPDATEDDTSLDARQVSPPELSHTASVDRSIYIQNQPPAAA